MNTTPQQQTALEKPVVRIVYFAEFQFASGTQYLNTTSQTITWNGHDWIGVGTLGSISAIEETDGLEPKAVNFTLNAAQQSWLAMASGSVEEYRGRKAKLYMSPLDENFNLIDTPILCWTGYMDMVAIGIDGDAGQITLKCESSAIGLKRRPGLRLNHEQQMKRHDGDTGLEYLQDLIEKPQLWLSKKFQGL